jgi:acyl-CoA oxidase
MCPPSRNNAVDMQTTATFNRASQTFDLHTPSADGAKQWVLNSGRDVEYAVVWARLIVEDGDEGAHPFLCKLRENNGKLRRGVQFSDTGALLVLVTAGTSCCSCCACAMLY